MSSITQIGHFSICSLVDIIYRYHFLSLLVLVDSLPRCHLAGKKRRQRKEKERKKERERERKERKRSDHWLAFWLWRFALCYYAVRLDDARPLPFLFYYSEKTATAPPPPPLRGATHPPVCVLFLSHTHAHTHTHVNTRSHNQHFIKSKHNNNSKRLLMQQSPSV